jgi:hypothetical protein
MDIRLAAAREAQLAAQEHKRLASQALDRRDHLVRMLYTSGDFTYSHLAKMIGLTPEMIAKIINPQRRAARNR